MTTTTPAAPRALTTGWYQCLIAVRESGRLIADSWKTIAAVRKAGLVSWDACDLLYRLTPAGCAAIVAHEVPSAAEAKHTPEIRISRRKLLRSRLATGPGPAWKWLYDVNGPDGGIVVYGTDRLATARSRAKAEAKKLGATVVESW